MSKGEIKVNQVSQETFSTSLNNVSNDMVTAASSIGPLAQSLDSWTGKSGDAAKDRCNEALTNVTLIAGKFAEFAGDSADGKAAMEAVDNALADSMQEVGR